MRHGGFIIIAGQALPQKVSRWQRESGDLSAPKLLFQGLRGPILEQPGRDVVPLRFNVVCNGKDGFRYSGLEITIWGWTRGSGHGSSGVNAFRCGRASPGPEANEVCLRSLCLIHSCMTPYLNFSGGCRLSGFEHEQDASARIERWSRRCCCSLVGGCIIESG